MSKYCYQHGWKAVLFLFNRNKKVLVEQIERGKIHTAYAAPTPDQCDEPFCKNWAQVKIRSADTFEKRYKVRGATIV